VYTLTISNEPLITPHRTLLNQRPPSLASLGNSANSDNGFSSNVSVNSDGWGSWGVVLDCCGRDGGGKVIEGVIFKNVLNAT